MYPVLFQPDTRVGFGIRRAGGQHVPMRIVGRNLTSVLTRTYPQSSAPRAPRSCPDLQWHLPTSGHHAGSAGRIRHGGIGHKGSNRRQQQKLAHIGQDLMTGVQHSDYRGLVEVEIIRQGGTRVLPLWPACAKAVSGTITGLLEVASDLGEIRGHQQRNDDPDILGQPPVLVDRIDIGSVVVVIQRLFGVTAHHGPQGFGIVERLRYPSPQGPAGRRRSSVFQILRMPAGLCF